MDKLIKGLTSQKNKVLRLRQADRRQVFAEFGLPEGEKS